MDGRRLVKRCQSGDREALGLLYQTYLMPMRKIVSYYVHDAAAIQDILHDGFIIVFESIGTLKDTSKVEAWMTSIMKNLTFQYLKTNSSNKIVSLSDISCEENNSDSQTFVDISGDELNQIVNQLPEGYGKIFRLAVLEGLSHKEISSLLGIAPHSSSSQLTRAKAMLRRMITKYKGEIGALSIVAIILFVWHGFFKHRSDTSLSPTISQNIGEEEKPFFTDSINKTDKINESKPYQKREIDKGARPNIQNNLTNTDVRKDSVPSVDNDTTAHEPAMIPHEHSDQKGHIAKEKFPIRHSANTRNWSLALAYSGYEGDNDINRYKIPDPDAVDGDETDGEIEVTEKSCHYLPVVVGLTLNKSLSDRWSVETGLRYTFLRSDFLSESKLIIKERIQRIHYIGVPLKFNYRVVSYKGFTLYGQGGGEIDFPVNGKQSLAEFNPKSNRRKTSRININAPSQWSVEGGIGLQYHFTPTLSIYAEPSFRYYFNPGSDIKTIRQEKPLEFTIPVGLRFTW